MSQRNLRIPLALSAFAIAACVSTRGVGPTYERPASPLPAAFGETEPVEGERVAPDDARRTDWWAAFGDDELERIVRAVREHNHELRAGLAKLRQARALVRSARADGLPDLAFEPSFRRERTSDELEFLPGVTNGRTANTSTLPFTLGWEIDLFGRIQHTTEAAAADAEAARADFDALLLLLETEAASDYLTLRALDLEQDVVARSVTTQRDAVDLVQRRFELGAVSELDVARAGAQLATIEAELVALRAARARMQYALAVLVGEPATGFRVEPAPLVGLPPSIPAGVPSELLLARPDLRRAERRLAAENARIGIATAAFYPSLSLTGNFGWQATDEANLFESDARIWAVNPRLYVPLFQGGRNDANLERAQARYEEVVEQYQNAVLVALSEVESSLSTQRFLVAQRDVQQRAVAAALRARDVSVTQYEVGTLNYLSVLDAERTALDAQRAEARLRGDAFRNAVQLLRVLGGAW